MQNFVLLFIFLTIFGNSVISLPALNESDTECKKSIKDKLTASDVRDYITCNHEIWPRSDMEHDNRTMALHISVHPFSADFDDDTSVLNLRSWIALIWDDERLAWDPKKFTNVTNIEIPKPDRTVVIVDNDDTYDHGRNSTTCHVFFTGNVVCVVLAQQKIRCQTDFTLWPYDRQNCTLLITSWSQSTEKLIFERKREYPTVALQRLKFTQEWNVAVSRISFDSRPSHYYYDNIHHPQLSIDFVIDRLHSPAQGRFTASAIIMMSMTLSTLWLAPKSIERLAILSLNIIIHMMCLRDLHHALPQNGTTIPNILIFYVNSFVLSVVAILLTYVLGKIEEAKVLAPSWLLSGTDFILKSKAGKMLLVCMLDPKATAEIETVGDGYRDILSSGQEKLNWKYVAIFFGWIAFFSVFFAYVLMYALLIPNSSSRPPPNVVLENL